MIKSIFPQEKDSVIGARINISDVNEHISVAFIDALRDVVLLMNKGNNPIKKIVSSIENKIEESDIQSVREKIKELNGSISSISQLEGVQGTLNDKLIEILGLVYSPELSLSSNISDELMSLSKFLNEYKSLVQKKELEHVASIYPEGQPKVQEINKIEQFNKYK